MRHASRIQIPPAIIRPDSNKYAWPSRVAATTLCCCCKYYMQLQELFHCLVQRPDIHHTTSACARLRV